MKEWIASRFRGAKAGLNLDTEALSRYSDVIDLSIGDVDMTTDSRIIEAAFRDASAGCTHYGDPHGDPELIQAVANAWREDHGISVSPEELLITTSGSLAMAQAYVAMLDPGDEVILFSPYFTPYREQVEIAGGVPVDVPLSPENGWRIDRDMMERAVTPRTKAIVFNSPNNPTGRVLSPEELEAIASVAKEHDLFVIADEIYTKYVYSGAYIPMCTLPGMRERTVTICSFSKNFFMTGWRVGFSFAPAEFTAAMKGISGSLVYTVPSVSQRAAVKAMSLREELYAAYGELYRDRVLYAAERLKAHPDLTLTEPEGAFYLFPGTKARLSAKSITELLLNEAHVLVCPGDVFGLGGREHVRIACTCGKEKLREAFDRIDRVRFR